MYCLDRQNLDAYDFIRNQSRQKIFVLHTSGVGTSFIIHGNKIDEIKYAIRSSKISLRLIGCELLLIVSKVGFFLQVI